MSREELIEYIIKMAIIYEKNKKPKIDELFWNKIKSEVKNNIEVLKGEKNEV